MLESYGTSWSQRLQEINTLFDRSEFAQARDESLRLIQEFAEIPGVQFYCAGFLIDAGDQLQDIGAIHQGIEILESIRQTPGRDVCLARGAIALADLEVGKEEAAPQWQFLENASFQKGKGILLNLISEKAPTAPVPVWLAAGDALVRVGRELEAYYAYEQALRMAPGAPLPLGAKANSLRRLSPLLGHSEQSALEEARRSLAQALASPDLAREGFPSAREHFQSDLSDVERLLLEHPQRTMPEMEIAPEPGTVPPYLEQFLVYCRRWRLFLTYHIHDERVLPALGDTVFPSTIDGEDVASSFPPLAQLFNQIKEDFATARYLLFRALHPDDLQKSAGLMTRYADLADGSFCWLDNGLLKNTFSLSYNILDKIAFLANEYFRIHHNPQQVTFKNFWKASLVRNRKSQIPLTETTSTIHPGLREISNDAITGLVDMSRDLSSDRFRRLEQLRHAQTHRSLILLRHDAETAVRSPGVVSVHRRTLELESVRLLRLVKSAIFSLAAAIELEERRKLGPGRHVVRQRQVIEQKHGEHADRAYSGM